MCNLINKPHLNILIVICEIHQFIVHVVFSFAHWRFVCSKMRRTMYKMFFMCFWVVLSCSVYVQKTFILKT